MDSLIMDYSQSIRKEERKITFEEECQGICKEVKDSSLLLLLSLKQLG